LSAPSLTKAKSLIDENASEQCITQAFDVIFREIERYTKMIGNHSTADWGTYVRQSIKDIADNTFMNHEKLNTLLAEDNKLLDELTEEEDNDEEEAKDEEET